MSYTQPTVEDRETIAQMQALGHSQADIAGELNHSPSTISRELRRNADATGEYSAGWRDGPEVYLWVTQSQAACILPQKNGMIWRCQHVAASLKLKITCIL